MKWLRLLPTILVILVAMVFSIPAYADTANPDAPPTVERVRVYRNLLETGDWCMIWEANIPYAVPPTTPVNQTYIWRLMHTDGVTVLGITTGYPYEDDGYNYNVYSMYWSAAEVTALTMTWGTAYTLRLSGNPAVFITPPVYNFVINASDYTTLTATADNQAALASEILYLAGDLNVRWGLPTDYRLTLETESGTVLSIFGEDVFRGTIPGVQGLAPAAFRFVIEDISGADRSWNTTYQTSLENQYNGTWVQTAKNASRDLLGTNYDLTSIILLILLCVGLVIANLSLTGGDHWNALVDVGFVLVVAARLGVYGLAYLALVAAVCVIFIGMKLWRMVPGT